ncbi:MAG: DMT family transporter [Gammaproteobacteria bacterium]|nr:DMT family transporter [Gammaproteobacteria bacterium]
MRRFTPSPYLLLVLVALFWAGNSVLARSVRLEVPPLGLSFWRWVVAGAVLMPFVWRDMLAIWPLVRANLGQILLLSVLGVSNFNTFLYLGLQTTTAANAVLLLSVTPLVIIVCSRLLLGTAIGLRQGIGIAASLLGVLVIIARGELVHLLEFNLSSGDLWVLAAVFSWGFYSVLLKRRPAGFDGMPFLGYTIAFGTAFILPLYLWEVASGVSMHLTSTTLLSVLYVALFASILAYLFWNHAVERVGPNRAGQFVHLIPVFGSLMSVLLLGERLWLYHLVGILLVAAGIVLATLWSPDSGR